MFKLKEGIGKGKHNRSVISYKALLWLLVSMGLMLSSALTAAVMRWLNMFSLSVRLYVGCGFLLLAALTLAAFMLDCREEKQAWKAATLAERKKLYLELLEYLFAFAGGSGQFGRQYNELLKYIKSNCSDLFVYCSKDVLRCLNELLNYVESRNKAGNLQNSFSESEFKKCVLKLIRSINEDLTAETWSDFFPQALLQGATGGQKTSKPLLRRYK